MSVSLAIHTVALFAPLCAPAEAPPVAVRILDEALEAPPPTDAADRIDATTPPAPPPAAVPTSAASAILARADPDAPTTVENDASSDPSHTLPSTEALAMGDAPDRALVSTTGVLRRDATPANAADLALPTRDPAVAEPTTAAARPTPTRVKPAANADQALHTAQPQRAARAAHAASHVAHPSAAGAQPPATPAPAAPSATTKPTPSAPATSPPPVAQTPPASPAASTTPISASPPAPTPSPASPVEPPRTVGAASEAVPAPPPALASSAPSPVRPAPDPSSPPPTPLPAIAQEPPAAPPSPAKPLPKPAPTAATPQPSPEPPPAPAPEPPPTHEPPKPPPAPRPAPKAEVPKPKIRDDDAPPRPRGDGHGSRRGAAGVTWQRYVRTDAAGAVGTGGGNAAYIGDRDVVSPADRRAPTDTLRSDGEGDGDARNANPVASPVPAMNPGNTAPFAPVVAPTAVGHAAAGADATLVTANAGAPPGTAGDDAEELAPPAPGGRRTPALNLPFVAQAPNGTPASLGSGPGVSVAADPVPADADAHAQSTTATRTPARAPHRRSRRSRPVPPRTTPAPATVPSPAPDASGGSSLPAPTPPTPTPAPIADDFWASPVDGSAEPTPKVGEVTSDEVTKAHGWSDIAVLSADTPTAAETSVAIRKTPTGVWYDNVDDQLRAVWRYPAELRALGIRGEVVVQFAVERNGAVRDVKVISSSGYPELDLAAVSAVPVRVAPLPPGVHGPQYVRETFLYGGTALAP